MLPRFLKPKWLLQNLLPPALLSFFARPWYICVTEIGPRYIGHDLGRPVVGKIYSGFATVTICTITVLYLRLYFLPSNQSIPPPLQLYDPISTELFECSVPADTSKVAIKRDQVPLTFCDKPQCGHRWKPPRTRHCTECGKCRIGFDHHCAFFANCLTAPYIPAFLLTLLYTPPTVLILASPLLKPLAERAVQAYNISWTNQHIVDGWYGWTWSWFIAGGPVGRYVGGTVLGWRELDRLSMNTALRVEIGALVAIGLVLAMMTAGLAASTLETILKGDLTVDRERAKSFARLRGDMDRLVALGKPVSKRMTEQMERLAPRLFFWTPIGSSADDSFGREEITDRIGDRDAMDESTHLLDQFGVILPTLPGERPYDLGKRGNWQVYMGDGYGWILPWNGWRRSEALREVIAHWPINPDVEKRLRAEASRIGNTSREDCDP